MAICTPVVSAECDRCGEVSDQEELTPLARGSWDCRDIAKKLSRHGWKLEGGKALCPDCAEQVE